MPEFIKSIEAELIQNVGILNSARAAADANTDAMIAALAKWRADGYPMAPVPMATPAPPA